MCELDRIIGTTRWDDNTIDQTIVVHFILQAAVIVVALGIMILSAFGLGTGVIDGGYFAKVFFGCIAYVLLASTNTMIHIGTYRRVRSLTGQSAE